MSAPLREVFGPGGLLASTREGREASRDQTALAEAVDLAIHDRRHLLVEVPRDTGWGLACAVPASWYAATEGGQAILAVAGSAELERLLAEDLPRLARCLPWGLDFAPLRGMGSYLCLERLARAKEASAAPAAAGQGSSPEPALLADLLAWAEHTRTGDQAELCPRPPAEVWAKLSAQTEDCLGAGCPHHEACHGRRAALRARSAPVVVMSQPTLLSLLRARIATGGDQALPRFDVLVLDQAHRLADTARACLGWRLGFRDVQRLAQPLYALGLGWLGEALEREAEDFFEDLASLRRSEACVARLRLPSALPSLALIRRLELAGARYREAAVAAEVAGDQGAALPHNRRAQGCDLLATRVQEGVQLKDPEQVVSIERDARGRGVLLSQPLDVAALLREHLFTPTRTVVLCSDTLAAGGSFSMLRDEIGVPDPMTLVLEPPADLGKRILLVVPEGLPDPAERRWPLAVARQVAEVASLVPGRVLVLLGFHPNLDLARRALRGSHRPVLCQGDAPRPVLLEAFAREPAGVLLCSYPAWAEALDAVRGGACVVLDRLPFAASDDPVLDAIRERDQRWFGRLGLPRAVIAFRRIFGLLAREPGKRGALVVLDQRLTDKPYGRFFLRSLPPVRLCRRLDALPPFLDPDPVTQPLPGDLP